jgi:hypothetical protein
LRWEVGKLHPGTIRGKDQMLVGRDVSDASEAINRAEAILKETGRPGLTGLTDILQAHMVSYMRTQ